MATLLSAPARNPGGYTHLVGDDGRHAACRHSTLLSSGQTELPASVWTSSRSDLCGRCKRIAQKRTTSETTPNSTGR